MRCGARLRGWFPGVLCALVGVAGLPNDAQAETWRGGLRIGGSAERLPLELSQSRFLPGTSLPETSVDYAVRLRLFGEVEGRPTDRLGLTLGLDTGVLELSEDGALLDRRDFDDQLKNTGLLGRALAELQLGRDGFLAIRAGRYQTTVGGGAIYDAYAFGAELDIDLDLIDLAPVSLLTRVLLPDGTFTGLRKTSPLVDVQLEYRIGWTSRLTLLASVFFDTGNELSDPVRSALFKGLDDRFADVADRLADTFRIDRDAAATAVLAWVDRNALVETEGVLAWTGLAGRFGDDSFSVRIIALGLFGDLTIATIPTQERIDTFAELNLSEQLEDTLVNSIAVRREVAVTAFFGEVQASLGVSETMELGTFALVLTGDDGLQLRDESPRLGAFIGLSPLIPRTAVFFGGTFGPDQATPTAFSIAPDSSGILAAGGHIAGFWEAISARLSAAVMTALVPSRFTNGRLYGVEIDASLQIPIAGPFAGFLDGGVLLPGAFFEDDRPMVQVVAGVQAFLQSE